MSKLLKITFALPLAAVALTGCGGSNSSTRKAAVVAPTATSSSRSSTTADPSKPARKPRLRILSPRAGTTTKSTVAVRVALAGAHIAGSGAVKYVLDGSITRTGSTRLTFTGLAPGDHHLVVSLTANRSVKAAVAFAVAVPPAPPVTTMTTAVPTPPATTRTSALPPATTTTPAAGNGIPQGPNAGDGDGDNHGAPSDGDGNI